MHAILLACGVAALVFSVGYAVVSVANLLVVAALGVLVAHLGGGAHWTASTYGLQITTADEFRGRIFATDFALVTLTMMCRSPSPGWWPRAPAPAPSSPCSRRCRRCGRPRTSLPRAASRACPRPAGALGSIGAVDGA